MPSGFQGTSIYFLVIFSWNCHTTFCFVFSWNCHYGFFVFFLQNKFNKVFFQWLFKKRTVFTLKGFVITPSFAVVWCHFSFLSFFREKLISRKKNCQYYLKKEAHGLINIFLSSSIKNIFIKLLVDDDPHFHRIVVEFIVKLCYNIRVFLPITAELSCCCTSGLTGSH